MNDFFKTMMGRKFYDADVPRIAKALEKIGEELERANDLREMEMNLDDAPSSPKDIASEFMTK